MANRSIYIIYLDPRVKNEQWSFLHRFLHQGILEHDKKYAVVGFSLDISHHFFLLAKVRDFSKGKNKKIYIPYGLVSTMIELPGHKNRLGFLYSKEELEQPQ
jgi:hypothetical protein